MAPSSSQNKPHAAEGIEFRPNLIGIEEQPESLAEAWQSLFVATWNAYDRMMARRAARALSEPRMADTDTTSVSPNGTQPGLPPLQPTVNAERGGAQ